MQFAQLSDICEISMGQAPSGTSYNMDEEGYALLAGAGDFGELTPEPKKYTSMPTKLSKKGDLILCIRATIGDLNWSDKTYCLGRGVAGLRVIPDRLDSRYLWHFISTNKVQLSSKGTGSTFKQVNSTHIKEWEIPIPPLKEQKRIAAILDKADNLRRKRQQAIKLADEFLRAVFLDMFGDPVTNPKNHEMVPITKLASVITGNAFKSNEYVGDSSESVRLCRGANTLTGYFDWGDTVFWSKEKLKGLEAYLLEENDVILALDRPWISSGLKVCVYEKNQRDTYLVQRVARLRPKEKIYSDFIYACIKLKAFEGHCHPTETTVPHISPVELKNFEVPFPNKTEILKFDKIMSKSKEVLSHSLVCEVENEKIFKSLSQKAFLGDL